MKTQLYKGLKIALFSIFALIIFAIPILARYAPLVHANEYDYIIPMPLNTITVQMQNRDSWSDLHRYPGSGTNYRWFLSYSAQGNASTSTFTFTHNGNTTAAFCVQPRIPAPNSGTFQGTILSNSHPLAHALYWLSGPGSSQFWTAERLAFVPTTDIGCHITSATHLTLGFLYNGRSFGGVSFQNVSAIGRAGIQQIVSWLDTMPPIPTGGMSFSNANLFGVPYYGGGSTRLGLATLWTTFSATPGNEITMPIQGVARVERNRSGNITTHTGSVVLQNGDQFRFLTDELPPLQDRFWQSPLMYGSMPSFGGAVLINQGASTQTIGSWVGSIQYADPVSLIVDWDTEYEPQFGSLRITKTVEHWHTASGFSFELRRLIDNHLEGIFTTDSAGMIYIHSLEPGQYSIREIVPNGFVAPTPNPRIVTVIAGQTGELAATTNFHNIRQQGIITVTKQDRETGNRPQGDSTLNGAIFHLYCAVSGNLIQVLNTGNSASVTSQLLPLGRYVIVEVSPPRGYLLDTTRHYVTLSYADQYTAIVRESVTVSNQVIRGRISVVKFTDSVNPHNPQIMRPFEGVIFEVFLTSAGSFENALPSERAIIITNANGFAQTPLLPFGEYTVREIYAPLDVILVEPFQVFISEEGYIHRFILDNPLFTSLVRIVKVDATTGQTIPAAGTAFRIWDVTHGNWVSQTINYPTPITISTFHTDANGMLVMPLPLPSGEYRLYEIRAPYGYLLNNEPVTFVIHSSTAEGDIIEVIFANDPAMGVISIEKVCEETGNRLSGAVFHVIAAEDIITLDGTIRFRRGEIVYILTTDSQGRAQTMPLFLGRYYVVEVTAPQGFVLNPTTHTITLRYADQYTAIVHEFRTIENTPIRGVITVEKVCADTGRRLAGAIFEVRDALGNVVDIITTNAYGIATSRELPLGTFTVVEIYAPTGFVLNPTPHEVTLTAESQYVAIVHEFLTVENERIRGDIRIIKICSVTGEPLAGATFALYQDSVRIATATTNEYGISEFLDVLFGKFEIREIYAPEGFVLSDEVLKVNISENGAVIEITFENEPYVPYIPEPAPQTGESGFIVLGLVIIGIVPLAIVAMFKGNKRDKL